MQAAKIVSSDSLADYCQKRGITYRTVERAVALVSALLDVAFQRTGIKWLQKLEAAKQLARNTHDCSPVVKLSAVLIFG